MVQCTQDVPHMNGGAVAHFEHLKHRHSTQQANEKVRKLQDDELHRNIQLVNHDHTYCSKSKRNNLTQPALVVVETKREYGDARKGIHRYSM